MKVGEVTRGLEVWGIESAGRELKEIPGK